MHAREPQGSGYMRIFFDYLSYVHDRYEVTYSVLIWRNSNGAMQSVKNTITGVLGSMQNGKQLIRRIGGKQGNNTLSNGIYFKNDTVDVATVTIEDTHGNEQIITRLDA